MTKARFCEQSTGQYFASKLRFILAILLGESSAGSEISTSIILLFMVAHCVLAVAHWIRFSIDADYGSKNKWYEEPTWLFFHGAVYHFFSAVG